MDSSVSKKTQETLGKVIKKPPLTEKLLSKPPFRFLHDILTEVIKNTGVLKGLYKADEMNSENVKDKEAKIAFLQKAIDCVGILIGETLAARPSKIVAGHEPEKTNEFLQALGKVCMKKMDSSDAVKKTLSGEKPSSGKSRKKEGSRTSSKESTNDEKEKPKDRKKDDRKERGSASKDSSRKGKEEKDRNSAKEKEKVQDKAREKEKLREKEKKQEEETAKEKAPEPKKETLNERRENAIPEPSSDNAENEDDNGGNKTIQRPSSAKGQRRKPTNVEDEVQDSGVGEESSRNDEDNPLRQVSAVRRSARPSSARPAPPTVKRNDNVEDPGPRLDSGKQINTVIVDNGKDQDDEDDLFVVEDHTQHDPYLEQSRDDVQLEGDDDQHGSLVKKMLDSKREAETLQSKSMNQNKEKPLIIDATRKKEKELAQKEIEKLRNSIQTLCRSAHPLGKIMDYLQEDIDSMQKELEVWRKDNKKYALALKAEQSITESDVEPLHAQLGELELEISDMVDRISSVKSNIIRNDEKIRDMIAGVSR